MSGLPVLWQKAINWLKPPLAASPARGWLDITPPSPPGYFQLDAKVRPENLLQNPTVYGCLTLISNDIAKMGIRLTQLQTDSGVWVETVSPAFSPVLRKPNSYQTWIQFAANWISCKLSWGNVYALKQRDGRGVVIGLYILDPTSTVPLVSPDGSVYYQLNPDNLTGLEQQTVIVPASEIIHDRMNCLFHPLVGIGPLYAAKLAAEQGKQIITDSTKFFAQGAKPSGILVAPGQISTQTAQALKEYWNTNFTGENSGKVAVVGDSLKYEQIRMSSAESQTTEQIKLASALVAEAFHIPPFKLGGQIPTGLKVGDLNQIYYTDCLQPLVEEMEACLDLGLSLPLGMRTELDLDNLLRMDPTTMAEVVEKYVKAGVMKPNEGRRKLNLLPVAGGDTPYLQQQNYSLAALAKRDAQADPFGSATPPAPAPTPEPPPEEDTTAKALELLWKKSPESHTWT